MNIFNNKQSKELADILNEELEDSKENRPLTNYKSFWGRLFFLIAISILSYNVGKLNGKIENYDEGLITGMNLQSEFDDAVLNATKSYLDIKATENLSGVDLECFQLYDKYFKDIYYKIKTDKDLEGTLTLDSTLEDFFKKFAEYTDSSQENNDKIEESMKINQLNDNQNEEKNKVFIKY